MLWLVRSAATTMPLVMRVRLHSAATSATEAVAATKPGKLGAYAVGVIFALPVAFSAAVMIVGDWLETRYMTKAGPSIEKAKAAERERYARLQDARKHEKKSESCGAFRDAQQ